MKSKAMMGCLLVCGIAFGEDIYVNDFATRTSSQTVPDSNWHALTYDQTQPLYNNYKYKSESASFDAATAWSGDFQDGWVKAYADNMSDGNPDFVLAPDTAHGGSDNPCAAFKSSTDLRAYAVHSFGNEFTNGVLRFDVDMRRAAGGSWGTDNSKTYTIRLVPLYRKRVTDLGWGDGPTGRGATAFQCSPVIFGLTTAYSGTKDGNTRPVLMYAKDNGDTSELYLGQGQQLCGTGWYHWRVYVNLDNRHLNGYFWDAGDTQPDGSEVWDESTATRKIEADTYYLRNAMTKDLGGVAGFAVSTINANSGSTFDIANAPCCDNIKVAWKKSDGQGYKSGVYESFYENDFKVRRMRTIEPQGSVSQAYAQDAGVSDVDTYSYVNGMTVTTGITTEYKVSDFTRLVLEGANRNPEPVGWDNWRQISPQGDDTSAFFSIIQGAGNAGNVLSVSEKARWGVLGQLIGDTVTSGKVRISADVRLPKKWYQDQHRVSLGLGNMAHWSMSASYLNTDVGYGVITSDPAYPTERFCPGYLPPQPGSIADTVDTNTKLEPNGWYRMVVTADLDNQTYDYQLYKSTGNSQSSGAIDRTDMTVLVYEKTGIGFRNPISEISSFSLWSYGGGDAWLEFILWDNIQVWKDWNGSSGTLLYKNDFNTRSRYNSREKTPLVEGTNRSVGEDGWTRHYVYDGEALLMGTNRLVSFSCPYVSETYLTHPFGTNVLRGKVSVSVDMRPPDVWNTDKDYWARYVVYVGGDVFQQGNENPNDKFTSHSALRFGFGPGATSTKSLGRETNVVACVWNGGAWSHATTSAQGGHWYRFVAKAYCDTGKWTCRLYDMGVDHPDAQTPNGNCIQSWSNLDWGAPTEEGISAIGVWVKGLTGFEPWNVYAPGAALLDNIKVKREPVGFIIVVQ